MNGMLARLATGTRPAIRGSAVLTMRMGGNRGCCGTLSWRAPRDDMSWQLQQNVQSFPNRTLVV